MTFVKFPHIDNVETVLQNYPEVVEKARSVYDIWIATEKIDGTNFSISVYNDEVRFAKRTSMLDVDQDFYDYKKHMDVFQPIIDAMINDTFSGTQFTIFGEWFGPKILNRVWYGRKPQFRMFAAYTIDSDNHLEWFTFNELVSFARSYGLLDMIVPIVGTYYTFDAACKAVNNGITTFADDEHKSVMEGVVIQPLTTAPFGNHVQLCFKSKSAEFKESHATKIRKPIAELTDDEKASILYNTLFKQYCTEQRMFSVFSKLGTPADIKTDVSKYLVAFLDDAWEDFERDNPDVDLCDSKSRRTIRNIGDIGYKIFCAAVARAQVGD